MSGGNADIYQREILVLNLGAQERSDIHGFFHHQNMYRSIFGKLIHPQSGSGLTHFYSKFRIGDHHKTPRLGIACRRRQPGSFQNTFQLLRLYRTGHIISTVALT